ncbi:hypothetical protein [Mycobacterium shigaense]|uniref:hypothetical protein n=1 Tax=Mycobacterium shigaense TaxID=722731 RepID=UPI002AE04FF4|nr:hypothetical protein [Mycobacterium shigaense]MEA1121393.1 hypothetical protein [Mycobacterium shigaense]
MDLRNGPAVVSTRPIAETLTPPAKAIEGTQTMGDGKPGDAKEMTDEQREVERKLEHQDHDPEAPGLQQSRHDTADDTTR